MIKTKYTEIVVCDICDVEIPFELHCGICGRDVCVSHRSPSGSVVENRPEWYPLFDHLCVDCVTHSAMEELITHVGKIRELVKEIHRQYEDEMGQLTNKEGESE